MYSIEPLPTRVDTVLENANIINELQNQLKDDGTKSEYEIMTRPIELYPRENCAYDNYIFLKDECITKINTEWNLTWLDGQRTGGTCTRKDSDSKESTKKSAQNHEDIAVNVSVSPLPSINTKLKVILTLLNCIMTGFSVGFVYSLSVMFVDIIEEFQSSRTQTSPIMSVSSALMFGLGGVWGPLMTRFNGGYMCMIGGFTICIGCTISAFTTSLPLLIASLGGLTGIGLSVTFFLPFASVTEIYDKHRYIIMSVVTASLGIGACVVPYHTLILIESYGWRGALLINGSLLANFIPIGLLNGYVKKRIISHGQSETMYVKDLLSMSLFKNKEFLISVICMMLYNFLCPTTLQVLVDMFTEKGLSLTTGAVLMSTSGFSDFGGRLIGVGLLPFIKCSNKTKWAFCMATMSIPPLLYTLFFQYEYVLANTILFGVSWGMTNQSFPAMLMECAGPKYFSYAFGYCNFIGSVFSLIGGPIAGLIKDSSGSYNWVCRLTSINCGLGSLIMIMMIFNLKWTKGRGMKTCVPDEHITHM